MAQVAPTQPLEMWVVTDHTSDFPDHFVARKCFARAGMIEYTADTLKEESLSAVRSQLLAKGLVSIGRHHKDNPVVVETWL